MSARARCAATSVVVEQRAHVVLVETLDGVELVRGAKAVEEVEEGDARSKRRGVGDERQVLRLLHGRRAEKCEAGRARGHHVGVVAEDRERVGGERARGDVDDGGRELAGDLEHVREHQQQPLGRGERRRQRAGLQRAVHGAGGAALALHLDHLRHGAPGVRHSLRPTMCPPSSPIGGRRRDRVDRDHLARAVRDPGDRLVSVDRRLTSHMPRVSARPTAGIGATLTFGSDFPQRVVGARASIRLR